MVDALDKEVEKEKMKVNVQFKIMKQAYLFMPGMQGECCLVGDIRSLVHIHMNISSLCQKSNFESCKLKSSN